MTEPAEVLDLFEQANPVPPSSVPVPPMSPDAYLKRLLESNGDVGPRSNLNDQPTLDRDVSVARIDRSRWIYAAAAVLAIVGVAWIVFRSLTASNRVITEPTVPTTTPAITTEVTSAPTTTSTVVPETSSTLPTTTPQAVGSFDDPVELPSENRFADPGVYASDQMGAELVMEIPDRWRVSVNAPAFLALSGPGSSRPYDLDVAITRITELYDPLTGSPGDPTTTPDQIDEWISGLPDSVEVSTVSVVDVGGYEAKHFEMRLGDNHECVTDFGDTCRAFSRSKNGIVWITKDPPGSVHRVYWIEPEGEDPLLIYASTSGDNIDSWFATVDDFLASIEIGDIGPNPAPSE